MFKRALFLLLFFCLSLHSIATPLVFQTDSLVRILKLEDPNLKEHKLVKYVQDYFGGIAIDSVKSDKIKVDQFLVSYDVKNRDAYDLYIESIYQNRLLNKSYGNCCQGTRLLFIVYLF